MPNKNAFLRYQALDACFRDKTKKYFIKDLRKACAFKLYYDDDENLISRETIFADMRFMKSKTSGWEAPIEVKYEGKQTYYRYSRPFSISEQKITDDEIRAIENALAALERLVGGKNMEYLQEIISGLKGSLGVKSTNKKSVVLYDQNKKLEGIQNLPCIIDAATNQVVLSVMYRNFKVGGENRFYHISPYIVKQFNNRWFLFGLDNETGYLMNLALDRILSVGMLDTERYIENTIMDVDHYFDDFIGVTLPLKKDEEGKTVKVEVQKIKLKFSEKRYPYVRTKPIHITQHEVSGDDCTVEIAVRPNRELTAKILEYGPDVEVLEPAYYREFIARKYIESLKKYPEIK